MRLAKFVKQPNEFKDYDVDYSPWLDPIDDTLNDVEALVECLTDPDNETLIVDEVIITVDRAKIWVKGGTDGHRYKISLIATTVVGRIDESELIFTIKDY